MTTAYLDWSLEVECPACHEEFDLAKDDDDNVVANAIFNNNWEALEGYEAICPECFHEFLLTEVVH